jgi:hypothetical protein
VWYAIPDWMRSTGAHIRIVGPGPFAGGLVVAGAAAASRRNEGVLNPADLEDLEDEVG